MNDETQVRRGRVQIILLALVFFGPLLLAIWMYYGNSRSDGDAGVNYGQLLTPPITLDAKVHFDTELRGKWTLLYLPGAECDQDCANALINLRQIRLATGREIDRIERAVIAVTMPPGIDALFAEHPGLRSIDSQTAHGEAVNRAFEGLARGHIYILDPLGNLIMKYPQEPDRKGVLRDLKKLLKFSRIG